jgi:hypothetical protein
MRDRPLVDRTERKAITARMRRGEPAPTAGQARTEMAAAEMVVRAWWLPTIWLVVGLINLTLVVVGDADLRPIAVVCTLITLGLGLGMELHRRRAARVLDANRRRWG